MSLRVLVAPSENVGSPDLELDDETLARLYAAPHGSWLRVNMVSSLDGAAWGSDGRTGSLNNAVDRRVFALLRRLADAVIVGAGTARRESYRPTAKPLVLVSESGAVPHQLADPEAAVLLVTRSSARHLHESREVLGRDAVLTLGDDEVDLRRLRPALAERGLEALLCEGGPQLLGSMLAAGAVDELCLTQVPMVAGAGPDRIVTGSSAWAPASLELLLEDAGTLLARWFLHATADAQG